MCPIGILIGLKISCKIHTTKTKTWHIVVDYRTLHTWLTYLLYVTLNFFGNFKTFFRDNLLMFELSKMVNVPSLSPSSIYIRCVIYYNAPTFKSCIWCKVRLNIGILWKRLLFELLLVPPAETNSVLPNMYSIIFKYWDTTQENTLDIVTYNK